MVSIKQTQSGNKGHEAETIVPNDTFCSYEAIGIYCLINHAHSYVLYHYLLYIYQFIKHPLLIIWAGIKSSPKMEYIYDMRQK